MDKNIKYSVYIINDDCIEDCFLNEDINAFTDIVKDYYIVYKCVEFETEQDAIKFLDGVFYGCDDRNPCGKIALCSWNECDEPYINILLNA